MKKSNLFKVISIFVIGAMLLAMFNVQVLAVTDDDEDEDDGGFTDITNTVNTNTNNSNTNRSNTNTNRNNTNTNNTNRTNNTASLYNNTNNLPQTGIEDSIPTVLLIVVFGISAVYAYKKIKEYRNI